MSTDDNLCIQSNKNSFHVTKNYEISVPHRWWHSWKVHAQDDGRHSRGQYFHWCWACSRWHERFAAHELDFPVACCDTKEETRGTFVCVGMISIVKHQCEQIWPFTSLICRLSLSLSFRSCNFCSVNFLNCHPNHEKTALKQNCDIYIVCLLETRVNDALHQENPSWSSHIAGRDFQYFGPVAPSACICQLLQFAGFALYTQTPYTLHHMHMH